MKKYRFEYFASCPIGLESILELEIKEAGAKNTELTRGGVHFEAYHEIALKVLLTTRTASRVFKKLYQFNALHEKDMYHELLQIKWQSHLEVHQTFRLNTVYGRLPERREHFTNSHFTTLKAKDAIVDSFFFELKKRPSIEKDHPDFSFLVRIDPNADEAFKEQEELYTITILYDLSGFPLHERGYRNHQTPAPVKENLAAGLILHSEWNPKKELFYDPMMGSGTFLIEAALIAENIPPTYLKLEQAPWSFLKSQWYQKDEYLTKAYEELKKQLMDQTRKGLDRLAKNPELIKGSDESRESLKSTIDSLNRAGLSHMTIHQKSFFDVTPPEKPTLFFMNPPYGERLLAEQPEKVLELYKNIGDFGKQKLKNHRLALLVAAKEHLHAVGLRTKRKIPFFNGPIECRLCLFELY